MTSLFARESDIEHERIRQVAEAAGVVPFAHPHLDLARALAAGRLRKANEREVLWLQHVLTHDRNPDRQRGRTERLRARLAWLRGQLGEHSEDAAPAPSSGDLPDAVTRALAIIAGGVEPPPKPASTEKQLARFDEELEDIQAAERIVAEMVEERRTGASLEAALRLRETHNAAVLRVFRTAQQFVEACEFERLVRQAHQHAGYSPRPDILPPPSIRGAGLQLGSESHWESAIAVFRRELESRGLLG